MASEGLVRRLFHGPLDVVGDVHGEVVALRDLLARLGYSPDGAHPRGRRLVFVGDLVDRGQDSPAVVRLVRDLVEGGRAQCVLGNHELNVLLRRRKPEHSWFEEGVPPFRHGRQVVPQARVAGEQERRAFLDFFASLPLALCSDDLVVVHACWDAGVAKVVEREADTLAAYERHLAWIDEDLARHGVADPVDVNLARQNHNPVKLLTSGREARSAPWLLNGECRRECRVAWWQDHKGPLPLVVFGHYWRTPLTREDDSERLFAGLPQGTMQGRAGLCIDYSVGRRFRERLAPGFTGRYVTQLAALRWPEMVLVFDNVEGELPLAEGGA
jgi:hypothetical protein